MLVRMRRSRNPHSLLAGKQMHGHFGRQLAVSYKTRHFPQDPAIMSLGLYENLHTNIYSSFIHNCQHLEATKMFFRRWWINSVHLDNRMVVLKIKELAKSWKDRKLKCMLQSEKSQSEKVSHYTCQLSDILEKKVKTSVVAKGCRGRTVKAQRMMLKAEKLLWMTLSWWTQVIYVVQNHRMYSMEREP
jgi:hypothetical protein